MDHSLKGLVIKCAQKQKQNASSQNIFGSNRLPHAQAMLLCMDGGCTFFLSKVLGVSKGDFPVRAEISDAPIVSFLALTQSALFCLSPVLLDFKKFVNSGTFAIAVYRDFNFVYHRFCGIYTGWCSLQLVFLPPK